MFLKMALGPFVRIPRIFNKTWGGNISFAACGLATRARDENQLAKLTVLTVLTKLTVLKSSRHAPSCRNPECADGTRSVPATMGGRPLVQKSYFFLNTYTTSSVAVSTSIGFLMS
jgi:hypothetical protein